MKAIKHPLCNTVLKAPEGDENCNDLHIFRSENAFGLGSGHTVNSFWRPNEDELASINAGAAIVLHVCGHTHPPLSVMVMNDVERETPKPADPKQSFPFTKKLVTFINKNLRNHPETKALTDEFLDILNDLKINNQPKPTK